MFNLSNILFGKQPPIRIGSAPYEELYPDGLTMGTLYVGKQGSGKTSALARHIVDYFDLYPERAVFVLDWSGDLTNKILSQFCQRMKREEKRIIYDELGHPDWVLPLPELTLEYGGTMEEEISRVRNNMDGLYTGSKEATILAGVAVNRTLPELFRVVSSYKNQQGENWQITEAERLIENPGELNKIITAVKAQLPEGTADYLRDRILNIKAQERDLRTYFLTQLLGWMKNPTMRARLGYCKPLWTPKEAIKRGQLVIVNGTRLINDPISRDYIFTQVWSLIKAELNRRTPADPTNFPVSVILDETRNLFDIPVFAKELGDISPVYRSRKVQLYIVIQALAQLDEDLAKKIWLLGNIVCFSLENKLDAEMMAYQLSGYDPRKVKLEPRALTQNPTTEPEKGQDRLGADWIQSLKFRQCIVKRYCSEQQKDPYIRYVKKTKDLPTGPLVVSLDEFKDSLLEQRGIKVRDALEVIEKRELPKSAPPKV